VSTTYVYCTTNVDDAVNLSMANLGPFPLGAVLSTPSVPAVTSNQEIIAVPRNLSMFNLYFLDTALSIDGDYIASLQILLHGHTPGSMIWWRWRKAAEAIGYWITDHTSHNTTIAARGHTYTFSVTGQSSSGYDDIGITLTKLP